MHLSQDPTTRRWRARVKRTFDGPDGPRVKRWSKTFHTKAAARSWALELEDLIDSGGDPDAPDPRAPKPTVGEWHARWWAARVAEPTTLAGDRSRIVAHILPRWKGVPLDEVSPLEVQSWVRLLSRTLAADTVRKVHSLLGQMCDDAVKERLIAVSPCVHTDLPTVPPGRELWLTEEQIGSIAAAVVSAGDGRHLAISAPSQPSAVEPVLTRLSRPADTENRSASQSFALIWTLYLTGARWGEIAGLRVQDLDFLRRRIRITQVSTRQGLKPYPKGRRNRTVPMPEQLSEVLAAHLGRASPASRSSLVFANARGGPVSDANFRHRIWKPAVEAAGLGCPTEDRPDECKAGRCAHLNPRIHDLRHSLASRLVQQGVPISEIAAQLGHGSIRTSERYSHLGEGRHDRVLEVLDRQSRRARQGPGA